jgi:hypothetical protein
MMMMMMNLHEILHNNCQVVIPETEGKVIIRVKKGREKTKHRPGV